MKPAVVAGLLAAGSLALLYDGAQAQFSPGARSAGMGGAGMVFSSGVDAIEWNPANLAFGGGWNVFLGELGAALLVSGASFDDLREIADASGAGNTAVVESLPTNGLALSTVSEGFSTTRAASAVGLPRPGSPLPSAGVAVGPFGFRVRSRVMENVRLSKEVTDLLVNGFDPARMLEYRVGDTGFRSTSFSEITGAYGTTLGRMGIGVALRYVKGHSLTEGRFFEPILDLAAETAEITGVAIESAGGSGYGLDVGLALDVAVGVRVSVAATNIVQKMTWEEDLVAHSATFVGCSTGSASCVQDDFGLDLDQLLDRFVGEPIDPSSVSLPVYRVAQDLFPGAFFPTVVRAGVGWSVGGTAVELVGSSVSPRGRQHAQWDERVSLGVEQRLWILTLRAGAAKGTDGVQALSGGLGFAMGPVDMDLSGGLMSGGFGLINSVVDTTENIGYAGGQLTVALQVRGGGR